MHNTPDDDDEFARYLASYLKDREDEYLVDNSCYNSHFETVGCTIVDRHKLEATIRKFISELP